MQVIYADVLFVINLYITYGLLLLTGIITKSSSKRLRLLLSSCFSGFYSLIILVPDISDTVVAVTRIPACLIIVLLAFSFSNKKHFLRLVVGFLAVNFVFAGLMFAMWYFFYPRGMYYNNGVVYFDIDTVSLIVLTAVCYAALKAGEYLLRLKAPSNTIYDLKIYVLGKVYSCRSFLDTGNGLKDHFTGYPVIIVNEASFKEILPEDVFDESKLSESRLKFRFIVCSGISGTGLLPSFTPEKVTISSFKESFETSDIVIAVTKTKIKNGNFDAVLPSDIFINQTSERGEKYVQKTT